MAAGKIGRPIKAAAPGQLVSLGLKVTADLKSRLEAAAQASGRTQSKEAELRLEMSFRDDAVMAWLRGFVEKRIAELEAALRRARAIGGRDHDDRD